MVRPNAIIACLIWLSIAQFACASADSIGPNGSNSEGLKGNDNQPLTGAGVSIGQVELTRPGKLTTNGGPDDAAHSNDSVNPTAVFFQNGDAIANMNINNGPPDFDHAEQVAGV